MGKLCLCKIKKETLFFSGMYMPTTELIMLLQYLFLSTCSFFGLEAPTTSD